MSQSSMGSFKILLGIGLMAASTLSLAGPKGQPFQEIQSQIDAINTDLDALSQAVADVEDQQHNHDPVEVAVDCDTGGSIAAVLDQYGHDTAPLTINVSGVCEEVAFILRDNVTIQGAAPGAGIHSASPVYGNITMSVGASNIVIQDLTLTGGAYGVLAAKGSQGRAINLDISQTNVALVAVNNTVLEVTGSNLHDNNVGGFVNTNATLRVSDTFVQFNNTGFSVQNNGMLDLSDADHVGGTTNGVTLSNSTTAIIGQLGARILVDDSQIASSNIGVFVRTQASAQFTGSNTLNNNGFAGVFAQKNTSLFFNSTNNQFNNNGFGIYCDPDSSYLVAGPVGTLPGTFSGNTSGDVAGCTTP